MRAFHVMLGALVVLALLAPSSLANDFADDNDENNDFAEFEDFDGDDTGFASVPETKPQINVKGSVPNVNSAAADDFQDTFEENDDDDGVVEEDTEFEHFDDEEFEGFAKNEPTEAPAVPMGEPKLKMADVPLHFR